MEVKQSALCLGELCTCVNFTADILSWNLISPLPPSLPTFIIFHAEECVACKPSFLSLTNFFLHLWKKKRIALPHLRGRQWVLSVVHLHLETISCALAGPSCLSDRLERSISWPSKARGYSSDWTRGRSAPKPCGQIRHRGEPRVSLSEDLS